jgi:hypothetical protein
MVRRQTCTSRQKEFWTGWSSSNTTKDTKEHEGNPAEKILLEVKHGGMYLRMPPRFIFAFVFPRVLCG